MSMQAKVAVVTGAGSGIGRGIAVRLDRDATAIGVWDLNGDAAAETAKMITDAGGKAIAVAADCADQAAIKDAAAKTRAANVWGVASSATGTTRCKMIGPWSY